MTETQIVCWIGYRMCGCILRSTQNCVVGVLLHHMFTRDILGVSFDCSIAVFKLIAQWGVNVYQNYVIESRATIIIITIFIDRHAFMS